MRSFVLVCLLLASSRALADGDGPDDLTFKVESNLRAGVAKVDISPPDGTPVIGHVRPTKGFRDRLHAAVLLLDDGRTKAAIVTLDLIASSPATVKDLREAVASASGAPPENIMVAC